MLSTLLIQVPWLPIAGIGMFVLAAPIIGRWLMGHRRVTRILLTFAVAAVIGVTLYPEPSESPAMRCSVGWPYMHPLAVETVANTALFIPAAFLATVVVRRPLLVAMSGSALSATIEITQALILVIGRACDTSDWLTNTLGSGVGAAIALVGIAWHRRATEPDRGGGRRREARAAAKQ